jgi:hypothetical protein
MHDDQQLDSAIEAEIECVRSLCRVILLLKSVLDHPMVRMTANPLKLKQIQDELSIIETESRKL